MEETITQNDQKNLLASIRSGAIPSERSKEYWSDAEREELTNRFWEGSGISELALVLQRSENAVVQQLIVMRLLTPPGKSRVRNTSQTKCHCPQCIESSCGYYDKKGGYCRVGAV